MEGGDGGDNQTPAPIREEGKAPMEWGKDLYKDILGREGS